MTFAKMQSLFSTTCIFLLFGGITAEYLLPDPPGVHNITLTTGPLVDYTRNDSYAATPTPRKLMLSVFRPATCPFTLPALYMPRKTAEYQGPYLQAIFNISQNLSPLFLEARLPTSSSHADNCSTPEDVPVLLFSPGYSVPRLLYSFLASAIASEGFMVITIDHPEDANIVTYPNGQAVYNNDSTQTTAVFKEHLPVRIADASFVVDQLSNATAMAELFPQRGHKPFSVNRIVMLGHSLGGVTAVLAAKADHRIRGAANWDGTFVELPPKSGISKPVLLMSHGDADSTWPQAWSRLNGPKLWVNVANVTHETFSDLPTLLQASGQDSAAFASLLGTVAPTEMVKILTRYTTSWMNGVFSGKMNEPLVQGQVPKQFPEITVVRKGNL